MKPFLDFPVSLSLPDKTLWLIFVIALIIFGAFSSALIYHWRKYGMKRRQVRLAEGVFTGGATILFVAAASAIIFF